MLLMGLAWFIQKEQENQAQSVAENSNQQNALPKNQDASNEAAVGWSVYQGGKYSFQYPNDWTVKEVNESLVSNEIVNRFVSIENPDKTFRVEIGVKNPDEKNVVPRNYRTGVPVGDFKRAEKNLSIGGGSAEKRYLVYSPWEDIVSSDGKTKTSVQSKNMHVQLVWFCKPSMSLKICDNFLLGNGDEAFVEVDGDWEMETTQWNIAESTFDKILSSFQPVIK